MIENDSTFVTIMALGAGGALVGILLAARCLVETVWRYKREAQPTPRSEIFWRLPLVFEPSTKAFYAMIVAMVIAERGAAVPEALPWCVGGGFAAAAVLQGLVAAVLGNPDRSGRLTRFVDTLGARLEKSRLDAGRVRIARRKALRVNVPGFSVSLAVLGLIETPAILIMVGTIIFVSSQV